MSVAMRTVRRNACLLLMLASTPAWADTVSDRWQSQVGRISAHAQSDARAAAIGARLDELGIAWKRESFEQKGMKGINLVGDLGGPDNAPLLLIGAHYDQVDVGHGATDNASGVAAVLELAAALKARPLAHHRVQVAFWDLEKRACSARRRG